MNEVLQTISNIGIVPVIAIDDASKAVPLARALAAGGLPAAGGCRRTAAGARRLPAAASDCFLIGSKRLKLDIEKHLIDTDDRLGDI